jgi:hypothetical protein
MRKNLIVWMSLPALVLALAGCKSTPPDHGAYLPVNVAVNDLENRTSLVLLSQGVQDSVTCPGIQEIRLPDGRLQVTAHLRNREERRIQVQANCEFKDGQGFVIDATVFQNVFLDENAQQDVQFVAMNDNARQYTIRIREAH